MRLARLLAIAALVGCGSDSTGPEETALVLTNSASSPVEIFLHAPCSGGVVPTERIQGNLLRTGQTRAFPVAPGCYDTGVALEDGRQAEFNGITLTDGTRYEITVTN